MVNVYEEGRLAWEEGTWTEGGHINTRGGVWNLEPEAEQGAELRGHVLDLTTGWV